MFSAVLKIRFFCYLLLHIYSISLSKLSSQYQSMDQSGNVRGPMTTHSMPIACRVCERVFFDNVSLVLHFESHLGNESSTPSQHGRTMAALRRSWHLPLNFSEFSSAERTNEARRVEFPRMNNYLRPCPFPVCSARPPNVLHSNLVQLPELKCVTPLNPSFDARWNLSQSNFHPTMSHKTVTSASTHPLSYSQFGARNFAHGLGTVPPLKFSEQSGGPEQFSDYKKPHVNQLEKPLPEIIVISDDEEDDKNPVETLDLTLKL